MKRCFYLLLILGLLPVPTADAADRQNTASRPYEILVLNFASNHESQVLQRELGASPRFRISDPLGADSGGVSTKAMISNLCKAGVKPDLLLISAHFAASWAGENGELSLQEMEELKCDLQCQDFFAGVQTVFLFACNNLLSAPKETEATDRYVDRLRRDHGKDFGIAEIAQAGLDMYNDLLGTTYASKMQRLFGNAQAILGLNGNAPLGPAAAEAFSRTLHRFRQTLGRTTVAEAVLELFAPGTRVPAGEALREAWLLEMLHAGGVRKPVALSGQYVESRLDLLEAAAHTDFRIPLKRADRLYCGSLSAWPEPVRVLSALTESDDLVPMLLPQIVEMSDRYCEQDINERRCQTLTEHMRGIPTLRGLLEQRIRESYLLAHRLESFGMLARLQWLEEPERQRFLLELVAQARDLFRNYSETTNDVVQLAVGKMPAVIGRYLIGDLGRLRDRLADRGEEAWTKVTIRRALNRFHEGFEKLTWVGADKVALSPGSRTVAASDGSGRLKIVDTERFDQPYVLPVSKRRLCVSDLVFADEQSLLVGLCNGTILRIQVPSGEEQVLLAHHGRSLAGLDVVEESGRFLIRWNPTAAESSATVEIYDGKWVKQCSWPIAGRHIGKPVFCAGLPLVALMRSDGGLEIVDYKKGARLRGLDSLRDVRSVQFNHAGSAAIIVSGLKLVYWYDLGGQVLRKLASSDGAVVAAIELPGSRYAIVEAARIRIIDALGKDVVGAISLEPYTQAAYYNALGTSITTASTTGQASIWNLTTGGLSGGIRHPESVVDVGGSRDGRYLITASRDGYARVYDTASHRVVGQFPDRDTIQSVMLFPDARFAITRSGGNRLELWDVGAMLKRGAAE